jgi:hypothetical protein
VKPVAQIIEETIEVEGFFETLEDLDKAYLQPALGHAAQP